MKKLVLDKNAIATLTASGAEPRSPFEPAQFGMSSGNLGFGAAHPGDPGFGAAHPGNPGFGAAHPGDPGFGALRVG